MRIGAKVHWFSAYKSPLRRLLCGNRVDDVRIATHRVSLALSDVLLRVDIPENSEVYYFEWNANLY
jgi:hypothetical protein